jgi:hypothetical protein
MKRPPKVADASISSQFKSNRGIYKLVKSLTEGASLEVSRGGEIVFLACDSSRLRCSFSQSTIQLLYNFRCCSSSFATMDSNTSALRARVRGMAMASISQP